MLLRRKTKKVILIILCSFLGLILAGVIALLIYEAPIPFDNYRTVGGPFIYFGEKLDGSEPGSFTEEDRLRMEAEGYYIKHPEFEDTFSFNYVEEFDIYLAVNDPLSCYAHDVASTYRNYATLDYTVSLEKNILTVTYTGWGYPADGTGEPQCLDKVYVFDVSNASLDNHPRLVSETAADPDAVYEYMQAFMRGNLKYDEDGRWFEKVDGEWVEIDGPPIRHK